MKSRKKLLETLIRLNYVTPDTKVTQLRNETYGRKSMIYLDAPTPSDRQGWERALEREGFKVHRSYWPGSATLEVQVSYFKGWHWDE
jgi:hypothetical protein